MSAVAASGDSSLALKSNGTVFSNSEDGNLYILSEDNVVGLVAAVPGGYQEKGRFKIADQGLPSWAHPVVSGGRLYIRNQNMLTAYDVTAKGAAHN